MNCFCFKLKEKYSKVQPTLYFDSYLPNSVVTQEIITSCKQSWAEALKNITLFYDEFYTYLFIHSPEIAKFFNSSNEEKKSNLNTIQVKAKSLIGMIQKVINDVVPTNSPESLLIKEKRIFQSIFKGHKMKEIQKHFYIPYTNAVFYALKKTLGNEIFTMEVSNCWSILYSHVFDLMFIEKGN